MARKTLSAGALHTGPDATASSTGLFLAGFVVLLVIALVAQLLFLPWRSWLPGAEGEKSMIRGVSAAVYSFMSHIP
jgi:light-harvesting complex 1 beta chain